MPFGPLPYITAFRAPRQRPNPMRKVDDMTVEGTEIIRLVCVDPPVSKSFQGFEKHIKQVVCATL